MFLVDAEGAGSDPGSNPGSNTALRVRRWNPSLHALESLDWPAALEPLRAPFDAELKAFSTGERTERRVPIADDESLIVSPLRPPPPNGPGQPAAPATPVFGYTVLQLDLAYIRAQLLPELAQRYFTLSNADGYRVAVTSNTPSGDAAPRTVLYRSDPQAPIDPAVADVSESLFGVRDFVFLNRGNGGPGGDNRRIIVNVFRGRGRGGDGERGGDGVRGGRGFDRDAGRWTLIAQHQSGSLDAAVAAARRRNLGISYGILLLLSVSVGMLALSSRRAQGLARQQMEFVAGVSHELRTPIAVIRSAAENLSQGVVGSPERVKRYGEAIGTEAVRLGEMVERVMQYAGLEAGRALGALTPVSTGEVIDSALRETAPLLTPSGVTVDRQVAPDLPPVLGDPIALRSAIQNLIANAVKYGGDDRWIAIRAARASEGRRPGIQITVEDHGAGIPAADLPHIFEPFFRGSDAIARQIQGNGLGLSIVRRIVSAHGGKVTVSTRPGGGSAFTITLPAADPGTFASAPASDTASFAASGGAAAHS